MKAPSSLLALAHPGTCVLADVTQFSPAGIVSRTLLHRDGLRVTLFGFSEGQELSEHATSSRALVQVLRGSAEWLVAGKPQTVRAGEILHLPPHTPHAVRAAEAFSMLLTLIREPEAHPLAIPA